MKSIKTKILLGIASIFLIGVILLAVNNVDNDITSLDREYATKIIRLDTIKVESFEEEIDFIRSVQASVISLTEPVGIPEGRGRELEDIYTLKKGLCFDRSRAIEKLLRIKGFETRHVFLVLNRDVSKIRGLLTPGIDSHAITEVKTKRGWLIVDSNQLWISLSSDNRPVSLADISDINEEEFSWKYPNGTSKLYTENYLPIYGLYSRHGRFYKPYNFIPDINWKEFMSNFSI